MPDRALKYPSRSTGFHNQETFPMMATRRRLAATTALVLAVVLLAGAAYLIRATLFGPKTITTFFTSATAIYPGDEVRVAGVSVGTIESIEPQAAQAKVILQVDRDVPIPADAKAVIVAQNLVAARYVQLAPAYESSGPTMADDAVIPIERTAVPVEWDEVKEQLMRLATDLGPTSDVSGTSVSRFIESAANAMGGNGDKLRRAIDQLSGVGRILADGSGNIVDILKNLQAFVTALRDSNEQIVQFEDRFASLTSVLDGSKSDLDAALKDLSVAVGEVQRFVAGTRDQTAEQLQRLNNVVQNLVDHKADLENVLHVAPTAFANAYNIYNPTTGTAVGSFLINNFANPPAFVCGAIGAIENATAPETAKLCGQYLGPGLRLANFNYLPFPTNLYLTKAPSPDMLVYSEPGLAPGGGGTAPQPPDMPPAVSAYTGAGDVAPPPGFGAPAGPPGILAPGGLPATPMPALYPGAPIPGPPTVENMLLPAGPVVDAPAPPGPAPLLPAEGIPGS
jgi:phospholipid/cholesterol/gamma-HCH transport system substrate-binding protein